MQPQAATADQDEPRDGGDAGLGRSVDHDGGHPVHRRVDAEQRAAQDPRGALHERVPEVDVDQVVAALGRLVVERDRARDRRGPAGCRARAVRAARPARAPGPRRPARPCRSSPTSLAAAAARSARARCPRPAGRSPGVRCMFGLPVGVGPGQFGEPAVELLAAGQRPGDDRVAVVGRPWPGAPVIAGGRSGRWISASMTWLTEPRSPATLRDLPAIRRRRKSRSRAYFASSVGPAKLVDLRGRRWP